MRESGYAAGRPPRRSTSCIRRPSRRFQGLMGEGAKGMDRGVEGGTEGGGGREGDVTAISSFHPSATATFPRPPLHRPSRPFLPPPSLRAGLVLSVTPGSRRRSHQ